MERRRAQRPQAETRCFQLCCWEQSGFQRRVPCPQAAAQPSWKAVWDWEQEPGTGAGLNPTQAHFPAAPRRSYDNRLSESELPLRQPPIGPV